MTGLICCTMECNLACEYCYEGNGRIKCYPNINDINDQFELGLNMIAQNIDELYQINDQRKTKVIFHGGEPLLITPTNLRSVMQDQRQKGHNIQWAVQSNGTLITNEHRELFKEYNVSVGVSIDGLKSHHDKYRVFKNGNPTYDIILKNLNDMCDDGIHCGVLATISNNNVLDLIDIYSEFVNKNINFSFNALYPNVNGNNAELSTNDYSRSICDLFDFWITDEKHNMGIRPFERIIAGLLNPEYGNPGCHWSKDCSNNFVAMDTCGNLYPCEHWVGNKDFCFGNIKNGLADSLKHNTLLASRYEKIKSSECKDCEIWEHCHGGCPWSAYTANGTVNSKDGAVCESRKIIIKHINNYITQHLAQKTNNHLLSKEPPAYEVPPKV